MADDENSAEELQEGEVSVVELQQEEENQGSVAAVEVQASQGVASVVQVQESQDGLAAQDQEEEGEEEGEPELGLSKGKSGSVKFNEPVKLDENEELERQYDELMEAPELMSALDMLSEAMLHDENEDVFGEDEDQPPLFFWEDMDEDEEECEDEDEEMYDEDEDGEMYDEGPRAGRKSNFNKGSFDITPEYIFNELKVADAMKDGEGQNIQSFIISKSFSSENVVVLLNLRRMHDGEWALDKTIAQGLKQETYGGVVSIDQYEFSDAPPPEGDQDAEKSKEAPDQSSRRTSSAQGETTGTFMELLKKLEDHVADVNKDISIARKLIKEIPPCRPCTEQNENYSEGGENGLVTNLAFDDLPFFDKLLKLFETMMSNDDEPCSCCRDPPGEEGMSTYNAVSSWLSEVMNDLKECTPISYFIPGDKGSTMEASEAAALISQDPDLLEQARQSGLLEVLMSSTNAPPNEEGNKSESDVEKNKSAPAVAVVIDEAEEEEEEDGLDIIDIADSMKRDVLELGEDVKQLAESVEQLLPVQVSVAGSMQVNLESASDIDEFIRKSQKADTAESKSDAGLAKIENSQVASVESKGKSENSVVADKEKSEKEVDKGKSENAVEKEKSENAVEKEKSENAVEKEKSENAVDKEKSENTVPAAEEENPVTDILSAFGMSMEDMEQDP